MNQAALPSAQRLRCAGRDTLSWLDRCFERSPAGWDFSAWPDRETLPQVNREAVASRLAEMAFWRMVAAPEMPEARLPSWLLAVRPFADADECLHELMPLASQAAMAVFPLASRDDRNPEQARIYLLPRCLTRDSRPRLSFAEAIPEDNSVLLVMPSWGGDGKIDGDSWQLAVALAGVATREPALRSRLGIDWICTGAVNRRGKVEAVELGNKAALAAATSRRWLLPEGDNVAQWRAAAGSAKEAFGVRSLTEAATYVREHGVLAHQFRFPGAVDELHVLLGGAVPPALAVSMQIFPRQLCLWHSEQMCGDAACLEKILGVLMAVERQSMPSDNLAAIEVRMRIRLEESRALTRLVSITGGNRIMGFGAMLAARHCRVNMVYRDIDAPPDQLDMIDFADAQNVLPRHGKVVGNNCPAAWRGRVNWEKLYAKTSPRAKETQDFQAEVDHLRQILWIGGCEPGGVMG